ncbi:MAG: hypothetical protein ACE5HE_02320 [Phycisphaerae bacterium]
MPRDDTGAQDLLIDLHLDRLDDRVRVWLETELLRDPLLRAKSDRLGRILRPLDHWSTVAAPPELTEKILRYVEHGTRGRLHATAPIAPAAEPRRRGIPSLREVIAIAASVLVLISLAGPGLSELRARSHRAVCASNLGSIFRGTTLYQQAFSGSLPFAGLAPNAAWLPTAAPERTYQSNSRHLYLVAKLNYGPKPRDFVCPACREAQPMHSDELANYNDFARACNISYDSLNMCGKRPNLHPPAPIAYLSDANPLFVNARFDSSIDPNRTNSPAHKGKCQRVLILDGSVKRLTLPIYGPKDDNLWLAGTIRRYNGTEAPVSNDDAFLIPGFPDTDPIILGKTAK